MSYDWWQKNGKLLGQFHLGHDLVDVMVTNECDGGSCYLENPDERFRPVVLIGLDQEWAEVLSTMLHECIEYLLARMEKAYFNTRTMTGPYTAWIFVFDHQGLDELACRMTEFVDVVTPLLKKAWEEARSCKLKSAGGNP